MVAVDYSGVGTWREWGGSYHYLRTQTVANGVTYPDFLNDDYIVGMWVIPYSEGQGAAGRLFRWGDNSPLVYGDLALITSPGINRLSYFAKYNTTHANPVSVDNYFTFGVPLFIGFWNDLSTKTAHLYGYRADQDTALTELANDTGTGTRYNPTIDRFYFGNEVAEDKAFDGVIGPTFIHSKTSYTQAEAEELLLRHWLGLAPLPSSGLWTYWPMDSHINHSGTNQDEDLEFDHGPNGYHLSEWWGTAARWPTNTAEGLHVVTGWGGGQAQAVGMPAVDVVDATVTPSTVACSFAVLSPTITASGVVTPSIVAATVAVPAPTIISAPIVQASTVAATFSIPSPIVTASSTVTPGVVTGVFAIPTTGVVVEPVLGTVAATVSVPPPTIVAIGVATPGTVAAAFSIPSPTITATGIPEAGIVACTFAVPSPTITASGTVSASTVAISAAVPSPTIETETVVLPGVVNATVTVKTVTITASGTVSAAVVVGTFAVPSPTISGTIVVPVGTVVGTFLVPSPTIISSAEVAPSNVAATVSVLSPTITADATVAVSVVAVTVMVPAANPVVPDVYEITLVTCRLYEATLVAARLYEADLVAARLYEDSLEL